ncbi:hypothetical protein CPC197_0313A, partial [Chlamydia psittaci C1/97]
MFHKCRQRIWNSIIEERLSFVAAIRGFSEVKNVGAAYRFTL